MRSEKSAEICRIKEVELFRNFMDRQIGGFEQIDRLLQLDVGSVLRRGHSRLRLEDLPQAALADGAFFRDLTNR